MDLARHPILWEPFKRFYSTSCSVCQLGTQLVTDYSMHICTRLYLWIKWSCKLYLQGKVQLDLIPSESNTTLCSSERLMASPLFRIHNANLAGWKTGSREIVGWKMAVWKDKNKISRPSHPGSSFSKNPETDASYSGHITSWNCKTSRGLQLEYIYPSINPFRVRVKIESANVELIGETR